MGDEPIYSRIRDLTREIVQNQDLLSDPKKRSQYEEYVVKDGELFENIGESDYQSFSLLCEFGSAKALVNEKRYSKIYKQSQSSLLRGILNAWRSKYMAEGSRGPESESAQGRGPCDEEDEGIVRLNWGAWFNDHYRVNVFPINNIRFNTLQGLLNEGKGTESYSKKARVVNQRGKNTRVNETKTLENDEVRDTQNSLILQELKSDLLSRIQGSDTDGEGVDLWELVLDRDPEKGFTSTCFNLFSLLSLLKDSQISMTSPSTVIEGAERESHKVLVFASSSKISPHSEKNTGIISNFTFKVWRDLCESYSHAAGRQT
ncbi:hypothetical protein OIY81_3615 [Cryptosporidium canis]|uniref:Uncharacterized protein n=1 Tax=Cryptosporidium canis TaxID=195482 RepID=A0ABQ8P7V0_9CRYT|nr:hypothetical protein OIY81_3615 [Cryptosporidium canis]KAJ1608343.1 hypothetical protein OJ252_2579 [Cryptosporidium canis]